MGDLLRHGYESPSHHGFSRGRLLEVGDGAPGSVEHPATGFAVRERAPARDRAGKGRRPASRLEPQLVVPARLQGGSRIPAPIGTRRQLLRPHGRVLSCRLGSASPRAPPRAEPPGVNHRAGRRTGRNGWGGSLWPPQPSALSTAVFWACNEGRLVACLCSRSREEYDCC